jgi:hypothetical protein
MMVAGTRTESYITTSPFAGFQVTEWLDSPGPGYTAWQEVTAGEWRVVADVDSYDEAVEACRDEGARPMQGGLETFRSLEERLNRVIGLAAQGFNYFVGFKDSGDPARPFGLSFGHTTERTIYTKDLHGLIH